MTIMQNTLLYDVLIAHARPIPVNELGGSWFFIEEQGIDVTYRQSATVSLNRIKLSDKTILDTTHLNYQTLQVLLGIVSQTS